MSDDIAELRKRYRAVEAPPWLATRIAGAVGARPRRWPQHAALAACAVALCAAAFLLPRMDDTAEMQLPAPSVSLASVGRMLPDSPPMPAPSLSQLRSVKAPPLPAKPELNAGDEPRSSLDKKATKPKEILYAHI